MARIINSPGVQIQEFDETALVVQDFGTNIFVMGFAPQGPINEIISPSSLSEFELIYGTPKTPAERYFYYSVAPLFGTGANIMLSRLPYGVNLGEGYGSLYGALVYPVVALSGSAVTSTNLAISATGYLLGKPKQFTLTEAQYLSCLNGQAFAWSSTALPPGSISDITNFGGAGMIVLNKAQSTINNKYEGYYIGVIDNTNLNPATPYNGIVTANTVTSSATSIYNYSEIPSSRLEFALSGTNLSQGTVSQAMENIAGFDTSSRTYNDTLNIGLVKLRQSTFTTDAIKLDYYIEEPYTASFDYYRQITDQNGGPINSFYVENVVANKTKNLNVLVNDYISNRLYGTWLDSNGIPTKSIRVISRSLSGILNDTTSYSNLSSTIGITPQALSDAVTGKSLDFADGLYPIGAYSDQTFLTKELGSIPLKIDRVLGLLDNDELFDIDVTVEAGLGTIHSVLCASGNVYYDDLVRVTGNLATGIDALTTTGNYNSPSTDVADLRGNYNTIASRFVTFAGTQRKDHIFVADPIRHILVQGTNSKMINDKSKNWSLNIFSPLRHQFSFINSSYAVGYANWARVNDKFAQMNVWVPFSGYVAADIAKSDRDFAYWSAPAGFTRGVITNVDDIAITPNQKQRDDLYKYNLNPITHMVRDGIIIMGQKTFNRTPSAFDRINIRRLFLRLEKQVKRIAKYYVFEPNTLYTRTRVVDDLTPIFEEAKRSTHQGIYDFLLVCDERNNTPDVIDRNELVIDVYIKPVHVAEFILVNFHATRTGANFAEILR